MDTLRGSFGVRWFYEAGSSLELGVVLESWAPVMLRMVQPWQLRQMDGDTVVVEVGESGWQLRDGAGHLVDLLWEQVVLLLDVLPARVRERGLVLERMRWQSAGPVELPRPVSAACARTMGELPQVGVSELRRKNAWRQAAA
jgi:hypothetical protein